MPDTEYYRQFLEEIDLGDHDLTKWEYNFTQDLLDKMPSTLSPSQINVIKRLALTYLKVELE